MAGLRCHVGCAVVDCSCGTAGTLRSLCGCMAAQLSCCAHDLRCSVTCVAKTAASTATPASNLKSFITTQAA